MTARMLFAGMAGCLALALAGCGPSAGPVTGKVLAAGQPLKGATISFVPKDNPSTPPLSAIIQDDGTFSVDNVPFGEMLVAVIPAPVQAPTVAGAAAVNRKRMIERNRQQGMVPPPEARSVKPQNVEPPPELVPKSYQDPLTTELTFTHDAANGEFNYDFK